MKEYYSPGKTQSLCNKIATFAQYPTETISEAFECFNEYTRAVPHHKFPKEDLVQKFYQGLTMASRTVIDASAGGSIIELTPTQAFTLFKKVADNDTWASSGRLHPVQPAGNVKGVLQVEKEDILEGKIDSLMRRLEKMETEKKEAQDLKAAEARSTCEECGEYSHVHKDCPEEAKVLDYMRKGDLPNFCYEQGRPQFNARSSIPNSVPLRIQLKDFMNEQAKINKDTVTKFKVIDKVLENIDSKVSKVGSSNHQVLNMMNMLETQAEQIVGRLSTNEGKLPGQPKCPEMEKAIQTRSGKETEDPERSAGARKP
jgi:ribosomal protein L32